MAPPALSRLPDPGHAAEWLAVAGMRLREAKRLEEAGAGCVGSAYLAGYAIECSLKALLAQRGVPRPEPGRDGHNLRTLWSSCDFALKDLSDQDGSKLYFMSHWSTDLRYQARKNTDIADADLLNGASKILSRITTHIRRNARRSR
jgi:HEPN domain-containing protein